MVKQSPIQIGATVSSCDGICSYRCSGAAHDQQTSIRKRVAVVGRHAKDVEIGVFDADRYFNDHLAIISSSPGIESRMEIISGRGNDSRPDTRGLFSDIESILRQSPRISADSCSRSKSVRLIPTTSDSQTSWNSQSGLLSKAANALPLNGSRKPKNNFLKWRIRCKCPCSNKKSVDVVDDEALYDQARPNVSVSTSLHPSFRDSPQMSNYNGLNSVDINDVTKIGMPCYHDNGKRARASITNGIEKSANALPPRGAGCSGGFPRLGRNRVFDPKCRAKSYMDFEDEFLVETALGVRIPKECVIDQEAKDGIPVFKPKEESLECNHCEGFSFPVLSASPESSALFSSPDDRPRPSVHARGSSDCSRDSSMGKSFDLQERSQGNFQSWSKPCSVQKEDTSATESRNSFSFPRVSLSSDESDEEELFSKRSGEFNCNAVKSSNAGEDGRKDPDSDSSSDLFEIESFSTQVGLSYPTYNSGRSSLETIYTSGFFHACDHPLPPTQLEDRAGSATFVQSGQTSVDWSIESKDSITRIENRSTIKSRPILRDKPRGSSGPQRTGIPLGACTNDKALIVTAPVSFSSGGKQLQQHATNSRRTPIQPR